MRYFSEDCKERAAIKSYKERLMKSLSEEDLYDVTMKILIMKLKKLVVWKELKENK